MLLVTGGSFLADQHTISYIENTDMNNRNYDYVYFIGGGYMNRDYFSYSYPSYNGFTERETEKLASQYNLTVMAKGMTTNINAYIFTNNKNAVPSDAGFEDMNVTDELRKAIAKTDVGNFDKVYGCGVGSMDYSTLKENFPSLDITQSEYDNGERIVSVNSEIKNGEEFDLSFMIIPDEIISNDVDSGYIPEIITKHIKVTDRATVADENSFGIPTMFTTILP